MKIDSVVTTTNALPEGSGQQYQTDDLFDQMVYQSNDHAGFQPVMDYPSLKTVKQQQKNECPSAYQSAPPPPPSLPPITAAEIVQRPPPSYEAIASESKGTLRLVSDVFKPGPFQSLHLELNAQVNPQHMSKRPNEQADHHGSDPVRMKSTRMNRAKFVLNRYSYPR